MNNEVKFKCNDTALPKITKMLKQLGLISEGDLSRVIRIGGDESVFNGATDKTSNDIYVNGNIDNTPYVANISKRRTNRSAQTNSQTCSAIQPYPTQGNPDNMAIEIIVQNHVAKNEMFTAWDITKEIRQNSNIQEKQHSVIKNIVHGIYANGDMGNYKREAIEIHGISGKPYLYLPDGSNSDDYFMNSNLTRESSPNSVGDLTV